MASPRLVVKVGGSLFDLRGLGGRLQQWLAGQRGRDVLLLPGGGPVVNVLRGLDRRHRLGDEAAHWLALHALTLNAHLLAALLAPRAEVVERLDACQALWRQGGVPVMDGYAFARADEGRPGCLPHSWAVTSDSLAARLAEVSGAERLVLLKSVTLPEGTEWSEAGRRGYVDPFFAEVVGRVPALQVQAVNFREWPPGRRSGGRR